MGCTNLEKIYHRREREQRMTQRRVDFLYTK